MKNGYYLFVVFCLLGLSTIGFSQQANSSQMLQKRMTVINKRVLSRYFKNSDSNKRLITNSLKKLSNQESEIVSEVIIQNWNGSAWENQYKTTFSANFDTMLSQDWNGTVWQNNSRDIFTYDGNNNLIEDLEQLFISSAFTDDFRFMYYYDNNNNDTLQVDQQWDGSQWNNVAQYQMSYDNNHNQLVEVYQQWYSNQWNNFQRYTSTYSSNNRITYLLETYSSTWNNSDLHTYTYDSSNNQITDVWQKWGGSWMDFQKDTVGYNSMNQETTDLTLSWDGLEWANDVLVTNSYNGNNELVKNVEQTWSGSAWVNYSQDSLTVDGNGNLTTDVYQIWNDTTNVWENQLKIIYTYSGATAVENNLNTTPSRYYLSNNYPNPFNPTTNIKYSMPSDGLVTLKVYDILGREVATLVNENQLAGSYTVKFNGSNLSSGVYIYQLKVNDFVSTKKLILMK